jgi:hypothetical protein
MATAKVYYSSKAVNPTPHLMLVNGGKGKEMNKGALEKTKPPVAGKAANKSKPKAKATNPALMPIIAGGVAAGVGGLLTEFGVNSLCNWLCYFVPSLSPIVNNRFVKAISKMAFGVALAFGAEKVKIMKINTYSGWIGSGGIAVGFAELARMFTSQATDFYMPVAMQSPQAKSQAIAQGAELPQVVAQKAQAGEVAAQAAMAGLADFDEEGIDDIVFVPMKYGSENGLSDLVILNRNFGWAN